MYHELGRVFIAPTSQGVPTKTSKGEIFLCRNQSSSYWFCINFFQWQYIPTSWPGGEQYSLKFHSGLLGYVGWVCSLLEGEGSDLHDSWEVCELWEGGNQARLETWSGVLQPQELERRCVCLNGTTMHQCMLSAAQLAFVSHEQRIKLFGITPQ